LGASQSLSPQRGEKVRVSGEEKTFEALAKSLSVILSEAKDLVFCPFLEILRPFCSLRMTGKETFARGSFGNGYNRRRGIIPALEIFLPPYFPGLPGATGDLCPPGPMGRRLRLSSYKMADFRPLIRRGHTIFPAGKIGVALGVTFFLTPNILCFNIIFNTTYCYLREFRDPPKLRRK
jgi:hypothetical protein